MLRKIKEKLNGKAREVKDNLAGKSKALISGGISVTAFGFFIMFVNSETKAIHEKIDIKDKAVREYIETKDTAARQYVDLKQEGVINALQAVKENQKEIKLTLRLISKRVYEIHKRKE